VAAQYLYLSSGLMKVTKESLQFFVETDHELTYKTERNTFHMLRVTNMALLTVIQFNIS